MAQKGMFRGISGGVKLWDRVRAGGEKTKTRRDRQMAAVEAQRKRDRLRNRERSKNTPAVLLPKQLGLEVC